MIVQIVRFESGLSSAEVREIYQERAPRYRAVPGLRQKCYLSTRATGEHGAVYVCDSKEDLESFRSSELRHTVATAYRGKGEPDVRTTEVVMTLRSE